MEISLIMDNDSGYVSHNQESTLDSSVENLYGKTKSFSTHDVYLSEDALLEKPSVKNNQNEYRRFDSFDSVINGSEESVKTELSGFEDSDRSDISFVVPEAKAIVWDSREWPENSGFDDRIGVSLTPNSNCSLGSNPSSSKVPHKTPLFSLNSNSAHKVLTNVTNTYDQNVNQAVIKSVFPDGDKENIHPSETPKKQYENRLTSDVSPDLFSEEEESNLSMPNKQKSPMKKLTKESYCNKDVKLLKKVQSCLSGVHPPPSLTINQMTATEMLSKIEENGNFFWREISDQEGKEEKSLLITDKSDAIHTTWPGILRSRFHGLHYNRSKISEDFEHLCSRYAERYVGAETQSTCTVFESTLPCSLKRKFSKPRWAAKSPGRRLSHLARRRITFSSANLQANGSSSILGSRARQILVDAKKLSTLHKKSPRKTPSKSPFKIRKNTPSSSAKRKLAMRFRQMSGEFEAAATSSSSSDHSVHSFKRALFSSPKREKNLVTAGGPIEKKSTKRALFSSPLKHSPQKKSPFKAAALDRKRKRTDLDEGNPSKFARSVSLDIKPTQSESKSTMNRTLSETNAGQLHSSRNEELSDLHKKKLQWAVYESLRLQNITSAHPQYKIFASVLARVTRKFLPSLRSEGRTTEKMIRIARYHSYAVVKGKTVDEIVKEYMKTKLKNQKPQGYVGIEEFNNLKSRSFVDKENVLQDKANIIESIEKRREHAGTKSKFLSENRIDRIKKVICFEENVNKP